MRAGPWLLAILLSAPEAQARRPARPEPLTKEAIRLVIRQHVLPIARCYQRPQRPAGVLIIRFTIGVTGLVTQAARAPESTLDDPAVTACILGEFHSLRFPAQSSEQVVTYPLRIHFAESEVRGSRAGADAP